METLLGGCHCGAVRFEVELTERVALDCNCSICTMKGFLHHIVNRDAFRLLEGRDTLRTYAFQTHVAQHHFCGVCGIHSFYVPRSHPDGIDVNVRCLDEVDLSEWEIQPFDGRNWEENIDGIR